MPENRRSPFTSAVSLTFGVVEPFHRAFQTFHFAPPRARAWSEDVPCPLMPFCGRAEGLSRHQKGRRDRGTSTPSRPRLLAQPEDAANRFCVANNALFYPLEGLLEGYKL